MATLLRVIAERIQPGTALSDRLLDWPGDITAAGASVPLRLAGALHGLVLDGSDDGLRGVYPPHDVPTDDALWSAVDAAMTLHSARIHRWLDRPPQTNEVGRSAVLIALGHWLTQRLKRPLHLSELGASAGLNLMWDHYAMATGTQRVGPQSAPLTLSPEWTGDQIPQDRPNVCQRRGVDLTPIDPKSPQEALRLQAYIWPDQRQRLHRCRAALSVADAIVDQADAADWLADRLGTQTSGTCHLVYHTIAQQYFPKPVTARIRQLLETAGTMATPDTPLAWFGMETDDRSPGAGMTLRLWPGDMCFDMGRVDFHGRWVDWRPKQVK